MNLNERMNAAQSECLRLLDAGYDWPDAQFRAAEMYGVDSDDLQAWYDADDLLEQAGESRRFSIGQ